MIYYPTPLHLQPMFASCGHKAGDLPHSESDAREVLSLPMYPELTEEQARHVVQALSSAL